MINRKHEIKVRLNDEELSNLNSKAESCGMSREKFVRHVLNNYQLKALPPIEYFALIKECNAIGVNLNQLTKLAYVQGIDEVKFNQLAVLIESAMLKLDKQIRGTG